MSNLKLFEAPQFVTTFNNIKLRLSDHNLPIEHGRQNNIPRHKRYCTKCKSGAVGDEFHTLMICCQPEIQSIRSLALYEISKLIPQFNMLSLKEKCIC